VRSVGIGVRAKLDRLPRVLLKTMARCKGIATDEAAVSADGAAIAGR
jgi:hypothetical protein